jgi:single-strand DNA-binding protein
MSIYNNWHIMGRLLANPELKTLPSGDVVLNGAVMIHEPYRNPKTNETGERELKVQFEQWGDAAVRTSNLVGVGDQVIVVGRLRPDNWVDSNGMPRTTLRIKADRVSLERPRAVREYTPDDAPVRNPDDVYAGAPF